MSFRARVSQGRIVIDQPVDLPEGTVLDLVVDDEGDELDDDERRVLHARLQASAAAGQAGHTRPLADILTALRG